VCDNTLYDPDNNVLRTALSALRFLLCMLRFCTIRVWRWMQCECVANRLIRFAIFANYCDPYRNNTLILNKIKIISVNVNSIIKNPRRASLYGLISKYNPDIVLVSETKLLLGAKKNHVLRFEKYDILRTYPGGGTAIIIKKDIKYNKIVIPAHTTVSWHYGTEMCTGTTNIAKRTLLSQHRIRRNGLQDNEGPGYTAVTTGEVIHIIKCVPVEYKIRQTEQCYHELPTNSSECLSILTTTIKNSRKKWNTARMQRSPAYNVQNPRGMVQNDPRTNGNDNTSDYPTSYASNLTLRQSNFTSNQWNLQQRRFRLLKNTHHVPGRYLPLSNLPSSCDPSTCQFLNLLCLKEPNLFCFSPPLWSSH